MQRRTIVQGLYFLHVKNLSEIRTRSQPTGVPNAGGQCRIKVSARGVTASGPTVLGARSWWEWKIFVLNTDMPLVDVSL